MVIGALTFAVACNAASRNTLISVSVCELAQNGQAMDGKQVRMQAILESDATHLFLLVDAKCRSLSMDFEWASAEGVHPSVGALREATETDAAYAYAVDISGTFHWLPHWQPPALLSALVKPQPRGLLTIEHVWSAEAKDVDWRKSSSK